MNRIQILSISACFLFLQACHQVQPDSNNYNKSLEPRISPQNLSYPRVENIHKGSWAYIHGGVYVGDMILGVWSDEEKTFLSTEGMDSEQVISLLGELGGSWLKMKVHRKDHYLPEEVELPREAILPVHSNGESVSMIVMKASSEYPPRSEPAPYQIHDSTSKWAVAWKEWMESIHAVMDYTMENLSADDKVTSPIQKWNEIKTGMSTNEVVVRIGRPLLSTFEPFDSNLVWVYKLRIYFPEGKVPLFEFITISNGRVFGIPDYSDVEERMEVIGRR